MPFTESRFGTPEAYSGIDAFSEGNAQLFKTQTINHLEQHIELLRTGHYEVSAEHIDIYVESLYGLIVEIEAIDPTDEIAMLPLKLKAIAIENELADKLNPNTYTFSS